MYKPYAERYIGILEGLLENPPEETPGWHASELETSQVLAHNADLVRMDRAADDRAQAPTWLPDSFLKTDGAPDVQFEGYQYFTFPMDHAEFSRTGVIGNPMRATAEKGEEALERFSDHLVRAIDEFRPLQRGGQPARVRGARVSTTPPALRRQQILERIQRDGGVSVADLARDLTVSSITVHRDLEQLSREGLVERVHGGARSLPGAGPADRDPADRLGAARGGQPRREGDDRRATRRARSARARRSSSTRRRPAWRSPASWSASPPPT